MRLCSIASGSSGNCIYVGSEATHLLVDVGVSCKKTEEGLRELDLSPTDVDGILITHEHSDHINGLAVISKKYHIPIYTTAATAQAIVDALGDKAPEDELFQIIKPDHKYSIKDLFVTPMHISHDAADPVAYRVSYGDKRIAVCTDLGTYNDYTVECLKGLDAILLEANHDVNMLQVGPYPYHLKKRILGDRGHLSNENSGKLLNSIVNDRMKAIVLGHLSKENNIPELAYEAVRMEITMGSCPYKAEDFDISVANRSTVSKIITL